MAVGKLAHHYLYSSNKLIVTQAVQSTESQMVIVPTTELALMAADKGTAEKRNHTVPIANVKERLVTTAYD
jgi:hypothetical protein